MKALDDLISDAPDLALRKVYADNFPWLQQYIRQHTGSVEDAQDIFQESVAAAWLNLKEGRFKGSREQFNAYVRQICKYKWINLLKSAPRRNMRLTEDLSVFESGDDGIEALGEQIRQSKLLTQCFSQLGEKCRQVLGLFYYKRQPLGKVAEAMGNTEESIKTIKYRCMTKLRKLYLENNRDE